MITIVGAGPVGLTLACLLQQYGAESQVLEARTSRSSHAKAIVLWSGAREVLRSIGAGDEITEFGEPLAHGHYYDRGRRVAAVKLDGIGELGFPGPLCVPQPIVEQVLIDRYLAGGGTIRLGVHAADLDAAADGVDLVSSTGDHYRSSFVVGADGVHSTVRTLAAIGFERSEYAENFVLFDGVLHEPGPRHTAEYRMSADVSCVRVSLPGGRNRVFLKSGRELLAADAVVADADAANTILATTPYGAFSFADLQTASSFRVFKGLAESFADDTGRVVLVGDAAHVHSPAGGQGMNTGIQDAHALAWRLAGIERGDLTHTAITDYSRERRAQAQRVLRMTDLQIRAWSTRNPLLRSVRNRVLARTAQRPDKVLRGIAQLDPVTPARRGRHSPTSLGRLVRAEDWATLQHLAAFDLGRGASVTYDSAATASRNSRHADISRLLADNGISSLSLRPDFAVATYANTTRRNDDHQ